MDAGSYFPSYFALEDILATQERIPCKFTSEVPRLGFIDSSSATEDLKSGTELEIPLWLARPLSSGRNKLVSIEIPKIYKDAYREILKADACAVDLSKLGNFFYEFGSYIATYDPKGDVGDILVQTFKSRFRYMMDLAQNTVSDPQASAKLDHLELSLFRRGLNTTILMDEWLLQGSSAITAGAMVTSYKKRKRAAMEEC